MNIAAYMAALKVTDVRSATKHALQVVCGHADRYTAMAQVSIGRVADDMGRSYNTALKALDELVEIGYLTVDKSPGQPNLWMLTARLTSAATAEVPLQSTQTTSAATADPLCNLYRGKESLEKNKGAATRRPQKSAGVAAGEKPGPRRLPDFVEQARRKATGTDGPGFTADELAARAAAREQRHQDQVAALADTDAEVIDLDAHRPDTPDG
jgi:hypothetical protein